MDALHGIALVLVSTALVNNFVLVEFLGLCPFMGVSRRLDSALGTGIATGFVLTLAAFLSHALDTFVLVPFGLEALRLIGFILIIAASVQFAEIVIRRRSPLLHRVMGLYLPLITSNCAVLGVALLAARRHLSMSEAVLTGLGASIGFTLVLVLFTAMRERIDAADVPAPFRGASVALIAAGLLSLGFMGFSGMTTR